MGTVRKKRQLMEKYWVGTDAHLATVKGSDVYVEISKADISGAYLMTFYSHEEVFRERKVLSVKPCDLKKDRLEGIMKDNLDVRFWESSCTPISIVNASALD